MIWAIHSRRVSVSNNSIQPESISYPFSKTTRALLIQIDVIGSKKQQLPPMDTKPSSEDILNAILPPREWVESGKHFIQYVSHQPASRVDVARLREMLDQKLMERQARESGICPVREELFSQCFDEIIRQVTLSEPERGLLLLRVRDEIKMTIAAYQTLYQSSVTFAMRK